MQVQIMAMIGNAIVENEIMPNIKSIRGAVIVANRMARTYDFIEGDGNLVMAVASKGNRTIYIDTISWNAGKTTRVKTYFDLRMGVHSCCYGESEKN